VWAVLRDKNPVGQGQGIPPLKEAKQVADQSPLGQEEKKKSTKEGTRGKRRPRQKAMENCFKVNGGGQGKPLGVETVSSRTGAGNEPPAERIKRNRSTENA